MKRTRSEWTKIVAEVERGASGVAVAQRHGVNLNTLKWWRAELRRERSTAPRILPVLMPEPTTFTGRVEVVVGSFTIRIDSNADLELVAKLAARLRNAC